MAALGIVLGTLAGLILDNLVLGLCIAAILFIAARAYSYFRIKNRDQS